VQLSGSLAAKASVSKTVIAKLPSVHHFAGAAKIGKGRPQ
jgi:hypothetical protein